MRDRPPPNSVAGAAFRRLRRHLAQVYKDQGGMGITCRVCGGHNDRGHPLCNDLALLADLEAWTKE